MLSFSERVRVLDLAQEHGVLEKRQWAACTKTPARKETTTPRTLRVWITLQSPFCSGGIHMYVSHTSCWKKNKTTLQTDMWRNVKRLFLKSPLVERQRGLRRRQRLFKTPLGLLHPCSGYNFLEKWSSVVFAVCSSKGELTACTLLALELGYDIILPWWKGPNVRWVPNHTDGRGQ